MDRRRILASLLALPLFESRARAEIGVEAPSAPSKNARLVRAGPVASRFDGEVIENLDVVSTSGDAVTITHSGVTVRHCLIRHAGGHGISAAGAKGLRLETLEIEHAGAPEFGEGQTLKPTTSPWTAVRKRPSHM